MEKGETYQTVYQRLLSSSQLQPLSKFKTYKSYSMAFPDAFKYPDFFNHNLLSEGRVIKVVRGKSALLKAFCYQMMKLAFEIQFLDADYVEIVKSILFHPALLVEDSDMQSPSSGRTYTDRQYKRVLAEFIELMLQQSIPNFELTLMEYPIVQQALIRIMEGIIERCYSGGQYYQTTEIIQWLSKTFQMGVEKHGKCYQFQQSDIFIYEENQYEFYIAYLNQMAEVSDYSESTYLIQGKSGVSETNNAQNSSLKSFPSPKKKEAEYTLPIESNNKYILPIQSNSKILNINIKPDYTVTYRKTVQNSKSYKDLTKELDQLCQNDKRSGKHSKIGSLLQIMSDRSSKDLSQPYKTSQELSSGQLSDEERKLATQRAAFIEQNEQTTPQFTTNHYLRNQDEQNPFNKKYSEQYMAHMYEKNMQFNIIEESLRKNYPILNPFTRDLFETNSNRAGSNQQYYIPFQSSLYKPGQLQSKNVLIDSLEDFVPQEEQDLIYKPKSNKKMVKHIQQPKIQTNQDSRGTLYRQFTDTRVLQAMTSHERLKVNVIRKKYKGRSRDIHNIY